MVSKWRPNQYHLELMGLYNIPWHEDPREMRPTFGSALLPLLNQENISPNGLYAPTMNALIQHFSLMQETKDDPVLWAILQQKPKHLRDIGRGAYQSLYYQILKPTREQLEKKRYIYLYNSPEVKVETNKKTGIPSIKVQGKQILKALPMSVQVAEAYGMNKHDIKEIAPEVIYVLDKKKCAHRTVREERELIVKIDGWLQLVEPSIRDQLYKSLKRSVPCIIKSPKVTQLLLPQGR